MNTTPLKFVHKAGPNAWFTRLMLIIFFQSVLFGSMAITFYAIFTLNIQLLAYLAVFSALQNLVNKNELFVKLVNKYIKPIDYYRTFTRIYEEQIPQQTPSLFSFHPHSVFSFCNDCFIVGLSSNINADQSKLSQMVGLASRMTLIFPLIGLQVRLWGVQAVNNSNFTRLMSQKKNIGFLPGGFEQATLTTPKQLRVFIKERKGFIKYALKYGYTIYPVLVYNEHKAFWTFDKFKSLRLKLNKLKFPGVIFGMGFLGIFLPFNVDLVTIVGKGIKRNPKYQNSTEVTSVQVNEIHSEYVQQLKRIHEKYRQQYGEAPLVFY